MKINQLFAVMITGLILVSCNQPGEKYVNQQNKTSDSVAVGQKMFQLTEKFRTISAFPYVADTTLMFKLDTYDSLGANEVKQLGRNWFVRDSMSSEAYAMEEFYKIDSLKASGNYAAWCDSLDIGMTKSSRACALGKITADEKTVLLIWGIVTSSYEACPYTITRSVYVSIERNGEVTQTFKLAEYVSSADPPVAMQRITAGIINKDLTIDVKMYEKGDEDMDLPEINVTREFYRYAIKDGKLTIISEKKEAPIKVKKKKMSSIYF